MMVLFLPRGGHMKPVSLRRFLALLVLCIHDLG